MARHHVHGHQLRLKGWSEEEISHAQEVLLRAEEKMHPLATTLDTVMFCLLFLIGIFGIAIFSIYAMPLFFFLPTGILYTTLALLGLLFGMLLTLVVADMHHLRPHHHAATSVVFFLLTFLSFVLALSVAHHFTQNSPHNILLVAGTFACGMLAPYGYHIFSTKRFA